MGIDINIKLIDKFRRSKVLVIGDLILDKFIWGNVERISPEAPVPVVVQERHSVMPGGASNVANNLAGLEAQDVFMVGVVGRDREGQQLKVELKKKGINTSGIFSDPARQTTIKTRIVAGHQQVVRLDNENIAPLSKNIISKLVNFTKKQIDKCDAVIIEDYGKGVICPELLRQIVSVAKLKKKIITVDPKEDHFKYYKGVTAITPNLKEASTAIGRKFKDDADVTRIGKELLANLGLKALLITMGEKGMRLFERSGKVNHIDTVAQEVFDVSGAGDTVIAAFTLGLASGLDFLTAAKIANICAGIVVGKIGVARVTREELIERLREYYG
jgi:D-beta-D-heptose 7-phosphate kinase/D-beta-D-heptose 1-phosphate adenosyltransferase